MAEERTFDRDKEKKYKIRINDDGEEELFIDEGTDEEEESEGLDFEVFDPEEDDEDAAMLTPEQLAAQKLREEQEKAEKKAKIENSFASAQACLDNGDMSGAIDFYNQIIELDDKNGGAYVGLVKAYSYLFSDYTAADEIEEATENASVYATAEEKASLLEYSEIITAEATARRAVMEECAEKNEEGKASRQGRFAEEKKKKGIIFMSTVIPFAVLLTLAIVFSTMMFSDKNGIFLVLTIVFAALAFVMMLVTAFTARGFVGAARNVRLNNMDTSTKSGRAYLKAKEDYELLEGIVELLSTTSAE